MSFINDYLSSAKVKRMINIKPDSKYLIPNVYQYSSLKLPTYKTDYLHILAGGSVHVEFPLAISYSPMNYYLCLYTDRGGASITQNERSVSITEKQLLLLDCHRPFSLQSFILPWDFKLFFFTGKDISLFHTILFDKTFSFFQIPEHSQILRAISSLLSLDTNVELHSVIEMHKDLTEILASLSLTCIPKKHSDTSAIPGYLLEMKDYLNHHYSEDFSLSEWEERYNINKYRLCREFSSAFQCSPLKYLIHIRLEESKKMLLTTDWTVHEISSKVGYDNVNHFINLFKKDTGLTPKNFRQTVPATQSALHFPVQ
ncbi:MAG: AraC family transcriptional regulator [Lachnospiraceae bacterium]